MPPRPPAVPNQVFASRFELVAPDAVPRTRVITVIVPAKRRRMLRDQLVGAAAIGAMVALVFVVVARAMGGL